jgi:hypothetical protein
MNISVSYENNINVRREGRERAGAGLLPLPARGVCSTANSGSRGGAETGELRGEKICSLSSSITRNDVIIVPSGAILGLP